MSDKTITQQAVDVRNRIAAINLELDDNQAVRIKLREEREVLSKLLASMGVEAQVQEHVAKAASASQTAQESLAAAEQARAEANQLKADFAAKNKEADDLIAKLKAQADASRLTNDPPISPPTMAMMMSIAGL